MYDWLLSDFFLSIYLVILFQNVQNTALCATMRQNVMSVPKDFFLLIKWNVKVSVLCDINTVVKFSHL